MKRPLCLMGLLLMGVGFAAFTIMTGPFEEIVAALNKGNVHELSKYLDNNVEVTIQNKSNSYSKAQTEVILTEFFNKNKVKSFKLVHPAGKSAEGSKYGIGKLVTSSGNYRTYFFLKQKNDKYLLQELRFENW